LHLLHEVLVIFEHPFRCFSCPKIISAGAQKDHLRFVRQNDPVRKMSRVLYLRSSEPAIDHILPRKILRQRAPHPDGRRTNEQKPAFRWWIGFVHPFKGRDLLFPPGKIMVRLASKRSNGEKNESAS